MYDGVLFKCVTIIINKCYFVASAAAAEKPIFERDGCESVTEGRKEGGEGSISVQYERRWRRLNVASNTSSHRRLPKLNLPVLQTLLRM